jgi:tetratricopeptide (TPR) repeat protein
MAQWFVGGRPMENVRRFRHWTIAILAFTLSSCASMRVSQDAQTGRTALQTNHLPEAVAYLSQAAALDPNYQFPNRAHESVLACLGRAYYESGDDANARRVLEQALRLDDNDSLAHLYLGLVLYRSRERDRGKIEIDKGLNGIHAWLEVANSDSVYGTYWDPNKAIRRTIERTLAGDPEVGEFSASAQRIGRQFDSEIDKERQSEIQSVYQGGKN